jgi:hypothetical protein
MCYNLYLATKVFEIPLGLFRGRGNDVAEGILVLSIINVAGMAAFFVYFFIATMWSCCNWDTHGQDLWEEEQRVVRAKAAEEQEKRKKEGIMRQVSNMSHESKQLLRAALGVAPPVIHV